MRKTVFSLFCSGTGEEPRAFLLPLLGQPHPSPLSHFVGYFVPLSERMFDYQQKAETEGRQAEAKVWAVLVNQIWGGLSGYCVGTKGLKKVRIPFSYEMVLTSSSEFGSRILPTLVPATIHSSGAEIFYSQGIEGHG